MGKYIKEHDAWFFIFEANKEKVTDKETLNKLSKVTGNSICLLELWSR